MERKIRLFWILVVLFTSVEEATVSAQELIFEKKVEHWHLRPDFGPNRKNFYHPILSASLIVPGSGILPIPLRKGISGQFRAGFRYKYNASKHLAIVTDCGIDQYCYRIDQISSKNFPDTLMHQSQSFSTGGLYGGAYLRIRLGQKGDYLGNYIDIGATGRASLINTLYTIDEIQPYGQTTIPTEITTRSRLRTSNRFSYGAMVKVGFDRLALVAGYRFSRLVDDSTGKDLPALEIGFEISPVRY